jgi:hypothetical protein
MAGKSGARTEGVEKAAGDLEVRREACNIEARLEQATSCAPGGGDGVGLKRRAGQHRGGRGGAGIQRAADQEPIQEAREVVRTFHGSGSRRWQTYWV